MSAFLAKLGSYTAFLAKLGSYLLTFAVSLLRGVIADRQERADTMNLGAARAEAATDSVIDAIEEKQDAIDRMDRGGAAGVLARMRRHGDGTAGDQRP